MEPLSSVPNCELLGDQLTKLCKTKMGPMPSLIDKLHERMCVNMREQHNRYCKKPAITVAYNSNNPKVNIDRW
jgi:hypothetical protein